MIARMKLSFTADHHRKWCSVLLYIRQCKGRRLWLFVLFMEAVCLHDALVHSVISRCEHSIRLCIPHLLPTRARLKHHPACRRDIDHLRTLGLGSDSPCDRMVSLRQNSPVNHEDSNAQPLPCVCDHYRSLVQYKRRECASSASSG